MVRTMKRRYLLLTLLVMACTWSHAVTVRCQPGKLANVVGKNTNETELIVTGSMDARDFRFIADHMRQLVSLNLSQVAIVACDNATKLFANRGNFRANELPATSLAMMEQLTTVKLPLQLTSIGEGAFAGCKRLEQVVMPPTVQYMGAYSFAECGSLSTISLSRKLVEIGEGAFAGCKSLTKVALDLYGDAPFAGAAVQASGSPGSLTIIGDYAFMGCEKLASFYMSNHWVRIGKAAFAGTAMKSVDLSAMSELSSIGNWAYAQTPVVTATLPAGLKNLGWGVFLNDAQLQSVASVHALTPLLLAGSGRVEEVDLSNLRSDTIGDYALYSLNRVKELSIPKNITHLGTRAMAGMTGLEQIHSHADAVPTLGDDVWQGVDQSAVALTVPASSVDEYKAAEQWREFDIYSSAVLGDVNGDGFIDVGDLNAIINYMLSKVTGTFIFDSADMDSNSSIDVIDVNLLINLMLNYVMANPSYNLPNTGDQIYLDNFSIKVGHAYNLELKLDNTQAYTALQCIVHLPDGLHLVDGKISVGSRASHHLMSSQVCGNEVRVILYAMPNVAIDDGDDLPVLTLTVQATDELADVAAILIDHVAMVTAEGDVYYAEPTLAQVSKTSGVNDVAMNNDRVYAANGVLHIVAQAETAATLVSMQGMKRTLPVDAGGNDYHNIDPGIYVVCLNGRSYKIRI